MPEEGEFVLSMSILKIISLGFGIKMSCHFSVVFRLCLVLFIELNLAVQFLLFTILCDLGAIQFSCGKFGGFLIDL